jgi:hypothetical protein
MSSLRFVSFEGFDLACIVKPNCKGKPDPEKEPFSV